MCCLVARGFQLKREQMYQQSPTVAFAQYANENQVISTQCITRQCSRLAGGKMITLHNDSLLLCIASGKTTLIFCLTCAVFQRMCQSLHENASSWLQTWLTFWVLSLCGKHEIKSCLTWQGEWVFVVPSCQFHCFEGFCPLWLCVLRSGLVLAWLKWRLWRLDSLQPLWKWSDFKVQPQTWRHSQPTHCLSPFRMDRVDHFGLSKMLKLWSILEGRTFNAQTTDNTFNNQRVDV